MSNENLAIHLFFLLMIIAGILYYQYSNRHTPYEKPAVVTIGWIGPLSGNAQILGVDNLDSVKLALTQYNAFVQL